MPTIVKRADGRFELRESRWTARGPRSRTLAIFRDLTPEVLDRAEGRSASSLDRAAIVSRAGELGLHVKRVLGSSEGPRLVGRALSGQLWPTHAKAVSDAIAGADDVELPDHLEAMVDWLGADDLDRGSSLVDLLRLADRIERSKKRWSRGELRYPRLRDCVAR